MDHRSTITVYELLRGLPRNGLGAVVKRVNWYGNSYWQVTRMRLKLDGRYAGAAALGSAFTLTHRHGKAWGTLVWNGQVVQENTQITGPLKKVWALVKAPPELPGEEGTQWLNVVRLRHIVDGTFPLDDPPTPVLDHKGRGPHAEVGQAVEGRTEGGQ